MENVLVYVIIAIAVIVNIVRTYQKEAKKNKDRTASQSPRPIVSSIPTPFSRRPSMAETSINTEVQNVSYAPVEYAFVNEGVSAIQEYIDNLEKSNFKDDEHFIKEEDSVKESFDLQLDTPEDFKRAFVHTLVFERKY